MLVVGRRCGVLSSVLHSLGRTVSSLVELTVNGVSVKVPENSTVSSACTQSGVHVPSFCRDARVPQVDNNCSSCTVEVDGKRVKACSTTVRDGIAVRVDSSAVKKSVRDILSCHSGDCIAPCEVTCPAHIDIMGYLHLAQSGRYREAIALVKERCPLPLSIGYVCPAFCEKNCRRSLVDESVGINSTKRFLAEEDLLRSGEKPYTPVCSPSTGKRVAVVGGGPAGLTAAYFLTRYGHKCVIFEKNEALGGYLRYGIPEYRLPKQMLDKELNSICEMGIETKCGVALGRDFTLSDLKRRGYDAVFLGTGCWSSSSLRIPNENADGVMNAVEFLGRVQRGQDLGLGPSDRVVVVGGGNSAVDAARSAIRLGVKDVTVLYRRSREEMPAFSEEVNAAEEEGVHLRLLSTVDEVVIDRGKAVALRCVQLELGQPDASGRRRPIRTPGSDFILTTSLLVSAIGQKVDIGPLSGEGVPFTEWGTVLANREDGSVNDFVYSGGDCLLGPATVIEAIATARIAADSIDAKLRGISMLSEEKKTYNHTLGVSPKDVRFKEQFKNLPKKKRVHPPELSPEERVNSFEAVEMGYTENDVHEETSRCLSCGCSDPNGCELRESATELEITQPECVIEPSVVDRSNPFYTVDPGKCIQCGLCITACNDVRNRNCITPEQLQITSYGKDLPTTIMMNRCESCGVCVDVCPVNARAEKEKIFVADNNNRVVCPYCGVGCRFVIGTREGKIVSVEGDKDAPASHGTYCVKGRFGLSYVTSPTRLKYPLIRGENGLLEKASWKEAIQKVASTLQDIKSRHGADSIAGFSSAKCSNEENYLFQKFMRAVVGTNNVDHCARLCHASTVAGLAASLGSGAMTNTIDELLDSDVIVVIGSNTTEAHPVIGDRIKQAVKQSGAKLIVVDPRAIDLTEFSTLHLQHTSGSDVAVINGMMNYIYSNGLHNSDFVSKRTEGWKETWKVVSEMTPKNASDISGVPVEMIEHAARLYAKGERGAIVWSMGITQHTTGTDNVLSLANLAMLTGHIGRHGAGLFPLRGQSNVQGACDMGCLPNVFPGYQKVDDEAMAKKFEDAWNAELPRKSGKTVTEVISGIDNGEIKALYVMGENPMLSDPNVNHLEKVLSKAELVVVQDIFLSEAARKADVVLPAACAVEKDGTFTNTERRVQLSHSILNSPGESKDDLSILCKISHAMGYRGMEYKGAKDVCKEIARVTPSYGGIVHDRLENGSTLQWPCPNRNHDGTPILHVGRFTRGKGKFTAVRYIAPAEMPDSEYPLLLTTGRVLSHFHTGTMTRKSKGLNEIVGEPFVEINEKDGRVVGIVDGDLTRVSTRRGSVLARVSFQKVGKGTIFMPFHFKEGSANRLTSDSVDPKCKIPEYKVCAAKIERVTMKDVSRDDPSKALFSPISNEDISVFVECKQGNVDEALMEKVKEFSNGKNVTLISKDSDSIQKYGFPVIRLPNVRGRNALKVICAGLDTIQSKWSLFVDGEMKEGIDKSVLMLLEAAAHSCPLAVVTKEYLTNGSPFPALFSAECAPFAKEQLDSPDGSLRSFLRSIEVVFA